MSNRRPLVLAHRGASAAFRENTLAAFRGAADLGADGVELDVRRTSDGRLAVHHDAHLADGRLISDLAADDLPGHVPLLAAALDACTGLVNVEIKNVGVDPDHDPTHAISDWVADVVEGWGGRALVSSFNPNAIARVRAHTDGRLPTGWLVGAQTAGPDPVERAARDGHDALHPHHAMTDADLIARAHDAGLEVNVWTVNDPAEIRRFADLGVDAIITDVPDVALAALG